MKLYLTLAFATFARHSFAAPALRGQEQETSSVSSLTSSFSRFGTGLCRDHYGYPYDRATFSGVDTRDACESTCAPIGGSWYLVGYEYSDTLNICSCRFTEGYINTSQLGGVGNCPSGAYADWGGEACKVVPPSQGRSGAGRVSQAVGRDSRFDCFRNENFVVCQDSPMLLHYACPRNYDQSRDQWHFTFTECEDWCNAQGRGCCSFGFSGYTNVKWCTWHGYLPSAELIAQSSPMSYDYAGIICGEETEVGVQNMIN